MYDIFFENRKLGHARLTKEGLYYRVHCTCSPPDNCVYRVIAEDGVNRRDLGICVPSGSQFVLSARIACKYLNADNLSFRLECNRTPKKAIPIADNTEFAYLDKLETARLQITNGRTEMIID